MTAPAEAGAADRSGLARSMVVVTTLTAVSRLTGFVRIVVIAAVVGYGLLGNVYQTANAVPNVVFELIVAGIVQAVLIPSLVVRLERRDQADAEHVAGAVLGLATIALGAAAIVGAVLAPLLARALFAGSPDPAQRAAQVHLGTILLWCFLPQVVCYGAGLVATSVLNAQHRFAAATAAPIGNNVVVIAACAAFWWLRDGAPTTLHLSALEIAVLGGGTTLGVVAFTALPVLAARRTGFRLRPNLDHRNPEVRDLGRRGAWSGLFLAGTQLLLVTVLVLGNRVRGGVVAYQVGFQCFLVPYALFALPVLTTLFPRLSRDHSAGDAPAFGAGVGAGIRTIAYLVAPAAALLLGLAPLAGRVLAFGDGDAAGSALLRDALAGFAPGLLGYGLYLFASRVSYARGDTRTPALVNLVLVLGGVLAMAIGATIAPADRIVLVLAGVHSAVYLVGAGLLLALVLAPLERADRPELARPVALPVAAALVVAVGLAVVVDRLGTGGRAVMAAEIAGLAAVGGTLYAGAVAALGGPRPATFLAALRGRSA